VARRSAIGRPSCASLSRIQRIERLRRALAVPLNRDADSSRPDALGLHVPIRLTLFIRVGRRRRIALVSRPRCSARRRSSPGCHASCLPIRQLMNLRTSRSVNLPSGWRPRLVTFASQRGNLMFVCHPRRGAAASLSFASSSCLRFRFHRQKVRGLEIKPRRVGEVTWPASRRIGTRLLRRDALTFHNAAHDMVAHAGMILHAPPRTIHQCS